MPLLDCIAATEPISLRHGPRRCLDCFYETQLLLRNQEDVPTMSMLAGKGQARKFGIGLLVLVILLALTLVLAWAHRQTNVAPKPPMHESLLSDHCFSRCKSFQIAVERDGDFSPTIGWLEVNGASQSASTPQLCCSRSLDWWGIPSPVERLRFWRIEAQGQT